jgi:hypothetical protein
MSAQRTEARRSRTPLLVAGAALVCLLAVGLLASRPSGRSEASRRTADAAEISAFAILGQRSSGGRSDTDTLAGDVIWQASGADPSFAAAFARTPWNVAGGGSVKVVEDPQRGRVLRSAVRPSRVPLKSQRAEAVARVTLHRGDTVWLGMDLWMAGGLGRSSTWQSILQIKTGGAADGSPAVSIEANAYGHDGLTIGGAHLAGSEPLHDIGPVPGSRWTRLVVGLHVSTSPRHAWVEVWRDGRQVLPREPWRAINQYGRRVVGGTMFPGGDRRNYLKLGLYRGARPFAAEARFTNLAISREASG